MNGNRKVDIISLVRKRAEFKYSPTLIQLINKD